MPLRGCLHVDTLGLKVRSQSTHPYLALAFTNACKEVWKTRTFGAVSTMLAGSRLYATLRHLICHTQARSKTQKCKAAVRTLYGKSNLDPWLKSCSRFLLLAVFPPFAAHAFLLPPFFAPFDTRKKHAFHVSLHDKRSGPCQENR